MNEVPMACATGDQPTYIDLVEHGTGDHVLVQLAGRCLGRIRYNRAQQVYEYYTEATLFQVPALQAESFESLRSAIASLIQS